jgi:hypothetical protein
MLYLIYIKIKSRRIGKLSEYSELVKNYNKIREYLRDFYIYGFRSRDSFVQKSSGRSYDNERRRIESYLGEI